MDDQESSVPPTKDVQRLEVGSRVVCTRSRLKGVVRYLGEAHFAEGRWCGIELDTPSGKNDGMVQGQRYFSTTEPQSGIFVRPEAVDFEGTTAEEPPPPNITKKANKPMSTKKPEKPAKVSYFVYNKLVGESDGGKALPAAEFKKVLDRYHESWKDRVCVVWRNSQGRDCIRVKWPFMCFCGHAYKSHAWWDAAATGCQCPGCHCPGYSYLHRQGSWVLHCRCKHPGPEHRRNGAPSSCQHAGCACEGFHSDYTCSCGETWSQHATVAELESTRQASGKSVDAEAVQHRLVEKSKKKLPPGTCGRCMHCKNLLPGCMAGKKITGRGPL